jgi:hypothetical protein
MRRNKVATPKPLPTPDPKIVPFPMMRYQRWVNNERIGLRLMKDPAQAEQHLLKVLSQRRDQLLRLGVTPERIDRELSALARVLFDACRPNKPSDTAA